MAQAQDTARLRMRDSQWYGGCDSEAYPSDLSQGQYAWGVNIFNRGGLIQTRPRRKRLFSFVGRNAQGLFAWRAFDSTQYLIWAIDGVIYFSVFPFSTYLPVTGIRFSQNVPKIFFCDSLQAVKYNPDATIALLPNPINWCFIQDGINAPAWFDGVTTYQPPVIANGVPIGTSMATCGNRLWVAADHMVLAGDLLNPTQFRENTYLAEQSSFRFPHSVTNLAIAPQSAGLAVQTDEDTFSLQANIQDRTLWQTTPLFQDIVTPGVGCVASGSFVNQNGLPWWFSSKGFISLDSALTSKISSVLNIRDSEMRRSKYKMSPNITGICAGFFRNMLLVAVPSMSQFNRHTWVMDCAVASKLNTQVPPCWVGVWTGTYPVAFCNVKNQGVEHLFELSYSSGVLQEHPPVKTGIHIWEDFIPIEKDDNSTRVRASVEFKMLLTHAGNQSTVMISPNSEELFQATFLELVLCNISGLVDLDIYLAGSAGNYELLTSVTLRADLGPFGNPAAMLISYGVPGTPDTILQSYRTQSRWVRSVEFRLNPSVTDSHNIEVGLSNCIDKGFQALLKWKGNMSVRTMKLYYRPVSEPITGTAAFDESLTQKIIVDA